MISNDENMKMFLQVKFNKKIEDINTSDLESLKTISIDSKTITNEDNSIDLNLLKMMTSLESLNINNINLSNELLNIINNNNIINLSFNNCSLDNNLDYSLLNKIKSISLRNTVVASYKILFESLSNITKLEIYSPFDDEIIDINNLNEKLELIVLDNCDLINIKNIVKCNNCKLISLYNSTFDSNDLNFLLDMTNLKEIILTNKELINKVGDKEIYDSYQKYTSDI